jgi:hypothetical protein
MVHRRLTPALLFVVQLAAQTPHPVPASHATQEGTSSTNVPFGRSTPVRVQYAYDAMLFSGPVTITAVSFRIDGGQTAATKLVDCEMRMSTMPVPLVGLGVDFSSNRGADEVVVLPRQFLTLPAQTSAATPNAFLPPIPLAVPFAYHPANGGLLLEIVVYGQPPGAYSLDVTWVCNSAEVLVGPASCLLSTGLPLRVESALTQVIWGRPWAARVLDAPPGAIVVLVLGSIESGPWAGMTLPQSLQSLGGPGCYLSIDIAGSWVSVAAGDGSAVFPFVVPNTPAALGEWIRFQAGAFDPPANALGLVTSQARKVQVCGWEPVGRVWSAGITAQFGTRELGLGAITQIWVQ